MLHLTSAGQAFSDTQAAEFLTQIKKSKPDTNRVDLLLKLATYHCFKPKIKASKADSALILCHLAESLSTQLGYIKGLGQSWMLLSKTLRDNNQPEKGKPYIGRSVELLNKYNYQLELGEAYLELSYYHPITLGKEIAERISITRQVVEAFHKAGNKQREGDALKELGDLHQVNGENALALLDLKEALKLYQSISFPKLQGVYYLLGSVYKELGDYREAIRNGLLAIAISESEKDSTALMSTIYNHMGITCYALNELQQANAYYQKALSIAKKNNDAESIHVLSLNIVPILLSLDKPTEALSFLKDIVKKYPSTDPSIRVFIASRFMNIYLRLKQYSIGQQYCNELLEIGAKNELDAPSHMAYYSAIIKFYLASKQYNEARKYLPGFEILATKLGNLKELSSISLSWFKLDSVQGNYGAAITHYQRYKNLSDSMVDESKTKEIARLQVQFESEKKDQSIQLKEKNIEVLIKEGQIQRNDLKQANLLKNVTFGGVALLLIIVILLYNRYRLKQQTNNQLEVQQKEITGKNQSLQHLVNEKEWLLKEIHHRVKNNLQMVMSLLNSQSAYLNSDAALLAIRDSQHRVQSISLIHQKLYQSESVYELSMPAYIQELVEYFRSAFSTGQRIRFQLNVEPVVLNVSQALPLGLILNEAITNSIKYAFPGDAEGSINISLQENTADHFLLTITDNGIGMSTHPDKQANDSLGMSLMHGLSEDIDARISIENNNGTIIKVAFKYERQESQKPALMETGIDNKLTSHE
ncbi:MAG: histidine kinase dimerization/phosphoacceptor domain -containing protein [Ferruginibacter sp.]